MGKWYELTTNKKVKLLIDIGKFQPNLSNKEMHIIQ